MAQPKHVLIVDDNTDVRDVIAEILQNFDFRVSSAPDGTTARAVLSAVEPVDCVILDSIMPGESSRSLALDLKSAGIPIVMMSGNFDAIENGEESSDLILHKPFSSQELCDAVNKALANTQYGPAAGRSWTCRE